LAVSYYEFDPQKAANCFEKAVKITPDLGAEAWHYMGVCYGELKKYQKAAECFGKAFKIDPENGENLFLMGRCYLRSENYQKALECLEEVAKIAPDEYEVWYEMGSVYDKLGNSQKAKECRQRADDLLHSEVAETNTVQLRDPGGFRKIWMVKNNDLEK